MKKNTAIQPKIGLILGSGLGEFAEEITESTKISYRDIPHFPVSTVSGHAGLLVTGMLEGKTVTAMQGRQHFYEGYGMQQITFPVRIMKNMGVDSLIVTNACGGLNSKLYPGALMLIRDHINLMGDNPLIGPNLDEFGPRFPDMSQAYDRQLIDIAKSAAQNLQIDILEGVHSAVSGPNYLSRAELQMVAKMGADTIGMSTIPETIVAVHCGLRVLGICCVTDMAIPDQLESISHKEVMEVATQTRPKFIRLLKQIISQIDR